MSTSNQSIRGFFTQSTKNVSEEKKKNGMSDKDTLSLKEKKDDKSKDQVKRAREASISPMNEKNQKKSFKKIVESSSSEDEILINEKENSVAIKEENSHLNTTEKNSESDDSPIKKSRIKGPHKRRKLVESSDSETECGNSQCDSADKSEKNLAEKKNSTDKMNLLSSTKKSEEKDHDHIKKIVSAKPTSNFFSKIKEANKSAGTKKTVEAVSEENDESKAIVEVKIKTISPTKEQVMMKLTVKKEESINEAYCKSTSKFFGGKVNDAANKESQISISASNDNTKQSYLPNKENYHPVDDACWVKGQPVPFKAIAQTLYAMEQTTKRLELLSIVCNYFRSVLTLTPKDLVPSMYMFTNKVAPDYEGLELGVGDTILFKALAEATGSTLAKLKTEFQNKGDIGLVAESNRCNQKLIFTPKKLTIAATFAKLREIASISGNSSGNKKTDVIKGLLVSCDSIEARYLMRALAGKLRNGLGENSILSALAHAFTITPPILEDGEIIVDTFAKLRKAGKVDEIKEKLEKSVKLVKHAYNQCPNYEQIVEAIITDGIENLENRCKLKSGVPLKPMLANPTKGIQEILKRFEGITFTCEYKYDGERAQIHILEDGSIKVFSRNSENNTSKYPDLIESLQEILELKSTKKSALSVVKNDTDIEEKTQNKKVTSAILDAEVVAYDIENKIILPFQVLSTRKRKDANVSEIKVKVCIFAFDLIMLNGKSLIGEPFRKRREYLYEYFPYTEARLMFATYMNSSDLEKIQEFLDQSIKDGCEGLMVKTLDTDAHYEISKRSYNWLKLKKDYLDGVGDTLDLVVIGGYLGTGKRTGVYGGYLLACYDQENEEYQTICKIGTGFKDEDLQVQFESLSKIKTDKQKSYYNVNSSLEQPDHWFEAEQVWEIKCADFSLSPVHTAAIGLVDPNRGMSMRFPRFLRLREDKSAEQATSSQQVTDMYNNQQQMINVNEKKAKKESASGDEEEY